jgi:hypothetical protein
MRLKRNSWECTVCEHKIVIEAIKDAVLLLIGVVDGFRGSLD